MKLFKIVHLVNKDYKKTKKMFSEGLNLTKKM